MIQNGQTDPEGVQRYVDERGIFAVKQSETSKNSSRAGSVAEQCARLKLIAEGKFVHSQKQI